MTVMSGVDAGEPGAPILPAKDSELCCHTHSFLHGAAKLGEKDQELGADQDAEEALFAACLHPLLALVLPLPSSGGKSTSAPVRQKSGRQPWENGRAARGDMFGCCSACPDAVPEGRNLYPARRGDAKDRVRGTAVAALIPHVDDTMLVQVCCRSAEVLSTKTKGSLGSPALRM